MMRTLRSGRAWAWVAGLAVAAGTGMVATPAVADSAPADPAVSKTVSADGLPTAQINGVVWDQEVVGNTVYVAGDFSKARPAGNDPGVGEVTRTYLMSYDITTGVMTSWAPVLNAQVKELAVSPDKTRLYAAGQFTSVSGQTRYRLAAFDTATGALISTFKPVVNATVNTVSASATAVAFGGTFTNVNGVARQNIAAVDLAGAALPFAPTPAGGSVQASTFAPDGQSVVFGGAFTTMNGSSNPGYGIARLTLATGALTALPVNTQVRNGGEDSAILSLESDNDNFYGAGYHFGGGGNVEGTFAADWGTGSLTWIEDCHGDTYSSYPVGGIIYSASHKHYCGNSGGFPQTDPWSFYRATALSKTVGGTNTPDIYGYPHHAGRPRPDILYWYPDINSGSFTGKNQGPWSVSGNSQYVLYGGEFTRVNNVKQQGLVRFAVPEIAPNLEEPVLKTTAWPLTAKSFAAGTVRLMWNSNWDRDNETLTYKLYRQSTNNPPIDTQVVTTPFWQPQTMSFTDTGLTPGSTQRYRVTATDPFGNVSVSEWITLTVSAGGTLSEYAGTVLEDDAVSYWRLDEPSGTTVYDWAGLSDATAGAGVTRGTAGAITGDNNTASTFNGTATGRAISSRAIAGPQTFAIEAWFKTTTTAGGKIVGFGNSATGSSSSYDRHVYMETNGRVSFGVYPGATRTVTSSTSYNDGKWHQVVASLGAEGMKLYIDGSRVAQRTDTTSAQGYTGYWRIGGDTSWAGAPYFNGSIDEVSIYSAPLSPNQVDAHWVAAGRTSTLPAAPADAYGAAVFGLNPDAYWRLNEGGGSAASDSGPFRNAATYSGGVTKGATGALVGLNNRAATFNGTNGLVASTATFTNPTTYSEELWFRTTTTAGGKLIGFGDASTGLSSNYDRHVYMDTAGRLTFGVWTGAENTITTPGAYNDGQWHHVVATQSAAGMALYVDGQLRGTHPQAGSQSYTGYWRVGGDNTWGGVQPWFAGTIDEVAIYSTALTAAQAAQHYQLGSGVVPNQAPVAAFTATPTDLTVAVDGTGSTDAEGPIASYAWTFQGGGTASTPTASYTFPAAGTYTVGLTVTDSAGASTHLDKQVTVTAPPVDEPPVAAFTATATDLTVAVDGTGSTDAEGPIASYAWTFEGGGTASTPTASYTFPAAGTYTVGLTVTDSAGASAHLDKQVTVTAPPPADQPPADAIAWDRFNRTVSGGWGSAQVGGPWTIGGVAARAAVDGSAGTHSMALGATLVSTLTGVSAANVDTSVSLSADKMLTGGGSWITLQGRTVGADSYGARVRLQPDGTVQLHLVRTGTALRGGTVTGLTYAPGETLRVRLQLVGSGPTTINAKIWKEAAPEPAAWTYSITDATAALQGAGGLALQSYLFGTATNAPVAIRFDNFAAVPAA